MERSQLPEMTERLRPSLEQTFRMEEARFLDADRAKRCGQKLPPLASGEWLRIRFDVLKRDGFRCTYCGVTAAEARLEVDHIQSRVAHGTHKLANLRTACHACNAGKGRRSL